MMEYEEKIMGKHLMFRVNSFDSGEEVNINNLKNTVIKLSLDLHLASVAETYSREIFMRTLQRKNCEENK